MTNIRLRIEDAIPAVGFGSVGTAHFSGTTTGSQGAEHHPGGLPHGPGGLPHGPGVPGQGGDHLIGAGDPATTGPEIVT